MEMLSETENPWENSVASSGPYTPPKRGIKRSNSGKDHHNNRSCQKPKLGFGEKDLSEPQYVIAHEVLCHRHPGHGRRKLYADVPQLLAACKKNTPLQGLEPFEEDILAPEYAEENPTVGFVVVKTYDCGAYHDRMSREAKFRTIPIPEHLSKALSEYKAELSFLVEDGGEAEGVKEKIFFISEDMKEVVEEIDKEHPMLMEEKDGNMSIEAPYLGIYHARHIFRDHISIYRGRVNPTIRLHLEFLRDYVFGSYAADYDQADEEFHSGFVSKNHFTKLFGANDVVIQESENGPMGYLIDEVRYTTLESLQIGCWSWAFDGKFYKVERTFNVDWPNGKLNVKLNSLPLFPLKFADQGVAEDIRKRGEKFWAFRTRKLVQYRTPSARFDFQTVSNRYMIDIETYKRMHHESNNLQEEDRENLDTSDLFPKDPFFLILPPTVQGYGFHDKKWINLSVGNVFDVDWKRDVFNDRLVLKLSKKELIKALVTVHNSAAGQQKSDIIEGKGKGLIVLLHGSPGTGKTLSAESIAEYAERPLYRVTCGDIGTEPESVEKYLESVFYVGTLWRCVVLLDEADVFLEERTPTDLHRNALVSVFLRSLEYSEGILILTSNRVVTFDEAFKSRVQLAIHYPPLTDDDRYKVWSMFFRDILESQEKAKYGELTDQLNHLKTYELNGRQIRNTINTARQLARYKKETISFSHLEQALEVVTEFEDYIATGRGHSDEDYAKEQRLR